MSASALTTGNAFTIAYHNGDRRMDTALTDRIRMIGLKLTLASGMYPSAGLKLPGFQSVGMVRRLDKYMMSPLLVASGNSGTAVSGALHVSLNACGTKILFSRIIKTGASINVAALATTKPVKSQVVYVEAVGW